MSEVSITIDDHEVRALLKRTPGNIKKAMRAAMGDSTALLLRDMKHYPTAPAGSTYERRKSGGYGGSWSRTFDDERGVVGSNSNMVRLKKPWRGVTAYNRFLGDDEFQTKVHKRTGWQTVQSVSAKRKPQIMKFFRERLRHNVK